MFKVVITHYASTVFYVDSPNPVLALQHVLSSPDIEPDDSQTITESIDASVAETDDYTRVVQGVNGPIIVCEEYYDLLRAREIEEEEFLSGPQDSEDWSCDDQDEEPIEWETNKFDGMK